MTDLVVRDRTQAVRDGAGTRTIVFDLPRPWLLHGLFRSAACVSHTAGVATVEVALATSEGYAVGTVVATDGADPDERSFEDYFSGGETRPADKAAITFRTDVHDAECVVPAVLDAAERASEMRATVECDST